MQTVVYLKGKKLPLTAQQMLAKGGEAEIYDLGNGQVAKIFKTPDHPDYEGLILEQRSTALRLQIHQQKLKQFPCHLPHNCITPQNLITDRSGQNILGYTMTLVENNKPLLFYSYRQFRIKTGISNQVISELFLHIHQTLTKIHRHRIVIGDFNDLNILVKGNEPFFIDTDSWQFEQFICNLFTARFVDPLLCDRQLNHLQLVKPHSPLSDWYSFAVALFQCWLFVHPYGGIYQPKHPQQRVIPDRRPLERITVFDPQVKYPKPAIPYTVFNPETLDYFQQIFMHDRREIFSLQILAMPWYKCAQCGIEHQHKQCPQCNVQTALQATFTQIKRKLQVRQIWANKGILIKGKLNHNRLIYLYHHQQQFRREDETTILGGDLSSDLVFDLSSEYTLIGKNSCTAVLAKDRSTQLLNTCQFACNSSNYYWIEQEKLWRNGQLGREYLGDVLGNKTQFWVGEQFGCGFYSIGNFFTILLFDAHKSGINDRLQIPNQGQMIIANCLFSDDQAWLFFQTQNQGRLENYIYVISRKGELIFNDRGTDILPSIYTACVTDNHLFVPTDTGIIKYQINANNLQISSEYPETEPYVNSQTQLIVSPQGIYSIDTNHIYLLSYR